jgi:hypothetical protein
MPTYLEVYVRSYDGECSQEPCSVNISWGALFPSDFYPCCLTTKLQRFRCLQRVYSPFLRRDTSYPHAIGILG